MARNRNDQSSGTMTVQQAGQRGGRVTASTHGPEFYREIGHKGGQKGGQRVRELIQEGKESERGHRSR